MSEVQKQLAEIEALVSVPLEPDRPKRQGVYDPRAGYRVQPRPEPEPIESDDDDEDAFEGEDDLPTAPAVRPAFAVAGLPDITAEPAMQAAQANLTRIADQQKVTAAQIAETESALGLKPGAAIRDPDRLAAQLLVSNKTDDTSERVARLETLRVHSRRLALANQIATTELHAAREKAGRELSAAAWEIEFKPAARASALALLALIVCKTREADARARLRAAGFNEPNGTFGSPLLDQFDNNVIRGLVRDGWLKKDEIAAACPHLGV